MVRKTSETDAFTPTEETSNTTVPTPITAAILPGFRALKLASEVQAALEQRYAGPTREIQGFTYIPWNESTKEANRVFGYFGWSSSVLSVDYVDIEIEVNTGTWRDKNFELKDFKGFKSIVRVSIQVIDDYSGQVITTHHDGVGYGTIQQQGLKDPMDTACKAAKSDGISTAIKHYGDAFGLYLYDKEEQTPQASTTTTSATARTSYTSTAASTGSGSGKPTEKMVYALVNYKHVPEDIVNQMDYAQAKVAMDMFSKGSTVSRVLAELGYAAQASNGTGDRLPIPAGR